MDIHNSITDIHNAIMDIHNYMLAITELWISIITGFMRFWLSIEIELKSAPDRVAMQNGPAAAMDGLPSNIHQLKALLRKSNGCLGNI